MKTIDRAAINHISQLRFSTYFLALYGVSDVIGGRVTADSIRFPYHHVTVKTAFRDGFYHVIGLTYVDDKHHKTDRYRHGRSHFIPVRCLTGNV